MHYGYSGLSRETNLLSEEIDLYFPKDFPLFYPRYAIYHNALRFSNYRLSLHNETHVGITEQATLDWNSISAKRAEILPYLSPLSR